MKHADPRIAILGGYGKMGFAVADKLLDTTPASVVLCGRNAERGKSAADALNRKHGGERASWRAVEASAKDGLSAVLRGARLAVVGTTGRHHTSEIVLSALDAGVDCVDLRFPQEIVPDLCAWRSAIERAGLRYFTQAGHFPGMPSVLARHVAGNGGSVRDIMMATAMTVPAVASPSAALEMVEVIRDYEGVVFDGGEWRPARPWHARRVFLEWGFGRRLCLPARLTEMRELPARFRLRRAGVYLAGINWFVDGLVAPLIMALRPFMDAALARRMAGILSWGIKTFSRPPFGAVFQVHAGADSENGGSLPAALSLYHCDSYQFAAAAAVAGLLQYLDGSLNGPGLKFIGHELEPGRFLNDMERMGVQVRQVPLPQRHEEQR